MSKHWTHELPPDRPRRVDEPSPLGLNRPTTTQVLAAYLLAVLIAVSLSLAVIHWMASCWDAGPQALCGLMATRRVRWGWLNRLAATARAVCLRKELEWAESALDNMEAVHQALPHEIQHQRRRVEALRADAIMAANTARGEA